MRFYYPQMFQTMNVKREDERLGQIEFAEHAPVRTAKVVEPPRPPEPKGVQKTLAQAEHFYTSRDLEGARELFLKALEQTDQKPLHAQAYYGLARIAALERNPEMAERLFEKTLELNPEPQVRAWTLVYLARLEDAAGERAKAVERYQEALAVAGASPAAHEAAENGVKQSFEKKPN